MTDAAQGGSAGAAMRRRARLGVFAGVALLAGVLAPAGPALAATYQVPSSVAGDCSVDVTSSLLSWIASVPDSSTLSFGTNKCYRIEGTLEFSARKGLDFEGNGSTFESLNAPADQRAMWRAWDSSGLIFNNMTIVGSYANGGTFDSTIQHAHGIDLRGTNAQVTNVSMRNLGGDCVYFGLGGTSALTRSSGGVTNSSCSGTGRNAISVTAGNNILVQHVSTDKIGYDVFDVEPNSANGFGSQSVTFDSNTIGSYALSAYSIVENEPISGQAFTNNTVVGRGLKVTVGQSSYPSTPAQNVTITGNSSNAPQDPASMNLSEINGVTVTGNTVPLNGGTMASVDTSCTVNVSGNSYPGGTTQAYIAPYASCPTSSTTTTSSGSSGPPGKKKHSLAAAPLAQTAGVHSARHAKRRHHRKHRRHLRDRHLRVQVRRHGLRA